MKTLVSGIEQPPLVRLARIVGFVAATALLTISAANGQPVYLEKFIYSR